MVHGVLMESTPKTSAGHRTIGLDEATFAVLKEHRRRQEVEKSLCPTGFWQRDGHIFTDDIGRPLVPDNVTKEFTRAVRRASLPRVRLHDTRHSNATALLRAGVDVKVVAGRLGHSSTAVTQNVYQHRVEQLDRAAAEKVAGMLFGARKKLQRARASSSGRTGGRPSRRRPSCSLPWSPGSRGRPATA
ncbi:MAG: site-specific integrase [Acidimicrobiales bacterium]